MDDLSTLWNVFSSIKEIVSASWGNIKTGQIDLLNLIGTAVPAYIGLSKLMKYQYHKFFTDPKAVWTKNTTYSQMMRHERQLKNSIPIIAVANHKGGVGKSTIVANLAAYYDSIGAKVLVIDFDDQGAQKRLLPVINYERLRHTSQEILRWRTKSFGFVGKVKKPERVGLSYKDTWLHASNSAFKRIEKKLQFDWLTKNIKKDIRFNLHEYLSEKNIQKYYDIILIDTPSGETMATANVLCAASHVLVPSEIDNVSSVRATDSLLSYQELRKELALGFSVLGVVPTMILTKKENGELGNREQKAYDELANDLAHFFRNTTSPITQQKEKISMIDHFIYRRVAFSLGEQDDAAFFVNDDVREMFIHLGQYLSKNLGKQGRIMNEKLKGKELEEALKISTYVAGQKIA